MKPENWDKMSNSEKRQYALKLLSTPRGIYIVSQALAVAIKAMKAKPEPQREISNIEDMEVLQAFFNLHPELDEFLKNKRV